MMRWILAGSLLLALACSSSPGDDELAFDPIVYETAAGDDKSDRPDLLLKIVQGFTVPERVGQTETRRVFRSAASFRRFFGVDPPFDFTNRWAVFYSGGLRETAGYTAAVTRVRTTDSGLTLKVTTRLGAPGPDCFPPRTPTRATVLVHFERPSAPEARYVRYYRDDLRESCGAGISPAGNGAAFVAQSIAARVAPSERFRVTVTMRNTGRTTWSLANMYFLGSELPRDSLTWGESRIYMDPDASVGPGASYTFAREVVAPSTPGRHAMRWQMLQDAVEWFGAPSTVAEIDVRAPEPGQAGNAARIAGAELPAGLRCGASVNASVTVENTGTSIWTRATHRLGAVGDEDPLAADTRIYLPEDVAVRPGERYTFRFSLRAPPQEGRYRTDWQMVHELVEWFGETASVEVEVTCGAPAVRRNGLVRLDGHSLRDDDGLFHALGATMMYAAWAYRHDRPRLERNLAYLSQNGFDYVRALGVVGDSFAPDSWDGREIDWRWPDYDEVIAGLTDLVYDVYGMRVEWTLIGDGQRNIPAESDRYRLADRFLAMSRGREHKIMHFEIANEFWQNGFSGDSGLTQLRALTRYLKDRTDVLVAASAPAGHDCAEIVSVYGGGVADLATIHFDRNVNLTDGHWRPVRQPWGLADCSDVPVGSNNEPIGPGSSVSSENDPVKLVAAAIVTYIANLPLYVFHSRAGVRGDLDFAEMAGADAFGLLRTLVPADLASWTRKNAHWSDSPFQAFAGDSNGRLIPDRMWPDLSGPTSGAVRIYAGVNGGEFFAFPFGILNYLVVAPRRPVEFDVIDPMTGSVLAHHVAEAGEQIRLEGREALILRGRFR